MPESSPADLSGRVLSERYRLEQRLGQGGMGAVWLARHLTLGSEVAVKVINPQLAGEDTFARFMAEAQAAAQLSSPHIVQIFDYGVDNGMPFLVMERLSGETLAERLRRVGAMAPALTAQLLLQVARGISRAHAANVVHRDLKPENIFLVENDGEVYAKVLDFGIAKTSQFLSGPLTPDTKSGAVWGTPHYMSPEQIEGAKHVTPSADTWSLGVIAYECLVGERPFNGPTVGALFVAICSKEAQPPSTRATVPAGFDAWFARATAREPGARFPSIRAAAEALAELSGARSALGESTPGSVGTPHELGESETERVATRPVAEADATARPELTSSTASPVSVQPELNVSGRALPAWVAAAVAVGLLGWFLFSSFSVGDPLSAEALDESGPGTSSAAPVRVPAAPPPRERAARNAPAPVVVTAEGSVSAPFKPGAAAVAQGARESVSGAPSGQPEAQAPRRTPPHSVRPRPGTKPKRSKPVVPRAKATEPKAKPTAPKAKQDEAPLFL